MLYLNSFCIVPKVLFNHSLSCDTTLDFHSDTTVKINRNTIDTNFVRNFEKGNVVELFNGVDGMKLTLINLKNGSDINLHSNSSAYVGAYFNYKWLMGLYSVSLPGTSLDKNIRVKSYNFSLRFTFNQFSIRPYYTHYNGLLIKNILNRRKFEMFRDIAYTNVGMDLLYFFNKQKFSYRAASSFSENQIKSNGSLFLMLLPQWQQITWKAPVRTFAKDSVIYNFLSSKPKWLSLAANIGYHYNFSIKKGMFNIAPAVSVGAGALREASSRGIHYGSVFNFQTWANAGYNGPLFYTYIGGKYNYLQSDRSETAIDKSDFDVYLTLGYRFKNYKKKILNIL